MRRRPNLVLVACLALVALIAAVIVLGSRSSSGIALASDNPGPNGGQALARVLGQHGVHVRTARTSDDLRGTLTSHSTVFVTAPFDYSPDARADLLDAIHGADRVVVVDPDPDTYHALFPGADPAGGPDAGRIVQGAPHDGTTPYAVDDTSMFANATITHGNNAAKAIELLGSGDDLVWISDWHDAASRSENGGLRWPSWKTPLTWALLLTVVVLALARGRRFGPLVTEPLPVTVAASESTRALASLYRRSRTREPAATALRAGTARRVGSRLALPAANRTPEHVAGALRSALDDDRAPETSGRSVAMGTLSPGRARELADQLTGPAPSNDRELVELATTLAHLEKEMTS